MSKPKLGMRVASNEDMTRLLPDTLVQEAEAATGEGYEVVFFVDETIDQITLGKMVNTMTSTYTTFTVSRIEGGDTTHEYGDVRITFDPNWRECERSEPLTEADIAAAKASINRKDS